MGVSQLDCVLTVGIPTFERAILWPSLIENLELLLSRCTFAIEIIVFDNHSGDETWEVISKWKSESQFQEQIHLHRQEENVGPARNLVDTMQHCRGHLYTFIGDDDRLVIDEFISVITFMSLNSDICAAIHVPEIQQRRIVNVSEAMKHIYEYGNAWMGIIRSDVLRMSLADQELVGLALRTIWPQTVLGLSQVQPNNASSVLLFPEVIGRRTQARTWAELTQPSAEYYIKSFEGLLDASISINNEEIREIAANSIAGTHSLVRKAHQMGMATSKRSRNFRRDCLRLENKLSTIKSRESRRARAVFLWLRLPIFGRISYVLSVKLLNVLASLRARVVGRSMQ